MVTAKLSPINFVGQLISEENAMQPIQVRSVVASASERVENRKSYVWFWEIHLKDSIYFWLFKISAYWREERWWWWRYCCCCRRGRCRRHCYFYTLSWCNASAMSSMQILGGGGGDDDHRLWLQLRLLFDYTGDYKKWREEHDVSK